jgi:hypothetical protein
MQNGNPIWSISGLDGIYCYEKCIHLDDYEEMPADWKKVQAGT